MIFSFPNYPSDKLLIYTPPINQKIYINHTPFSCVKTIIFFHIITGKYICGYDNNGKKVFSYLVSNFYTQALINKSSIILYN